MRSAERRAAQWRVDLIVALVTGGLRRSAMEVCSMVKIYEERFGETKSGKTVTRYTMENAAGMAVRILDYGCTIQSILVPDTEGIRRDVVLGYDDIDGYEAGSCYIGAFVGRYANRIKDAAFTLDGKEYHLSKNDGNNHLHGIYSFEMFSGSVEEGKLVFRRISPAGEEGYPGTLQMEVIYELREDNALVIQYRAVTDEDTVVNFTNHSYFNLNGDGGDVLGHTLMIGADYFTETDGESIPTGRILPVEGTPLDFRKEKLIGQDIFSEYQQVRQCRGFDHNYVLKTGEGTSGDIVKEKESGEIISQGKLSGETIPKARETGGDTVKDDSSAFTLKEPSVRDQKGESRQTVLLPFARAAGDKSGIVLEAYTTQPGVQLYTGNFVDEDAAPFGKNERRVPRYGGFCLETQHFPSSPNFPEFPSTLLSPGEEYRQITVYKFRG